AAGTKSWIVLGGPFRLQPAELAKLAVVLMVARWAADRRSPPATMRELMTPGVIVLVPFLLVWAQHDLGSAIVFVAILFAMLYWVGTRPALLLLLVSPAVGLILAFSTAAWGAWFLLILGLVLWWRIYLWEAVAALTLFITLILVLLRIARRATDQFSSLVVFGITGMLFTHIVENVGMTVNLLPITGIPLPFFSYGGSFLVTCCAAIGVALRVAW